MPRSALTSTLLLCGASVLAGCNVYDASKLENLGSVGAAPQRPPSGTSSPDDVAEVAYAIRDVLLNQGSEWRRIGLDLDGLDTQAPDFARECTAQFMSVPQDPTSDGENGIDNVFGARLWPVIEGFLPSLECEIEKSHGQGHGTLVLRLQRWNGTGTDASVTASLAPSVDGTSASADEVEFDGFDLVMRADTDVSAPEPAWEGNDTFFVNPRTFFAGDAAQPLVQDENAYVVNGVLVMTLPPDSRFELITEIRGVPIKLNQGSLLATLADDFESIVSGFAAGRYPVSDLLQVGDSIGICGETAAQLQASYERIADVLSVPRTGAPSPDLKCNAISMAVAFQGTRALWGGLADSPQPLPSFCDEQPAVPAECAP